MRPVRSAERFDGAIAESVLGFRVLGSDWPLTFPSFLYFGCVCWLNKQAKKLSKGFQQYAVCKVAAVTCLFTSVVNVC